MLFLIKKKRFFFSFLHSGVSPKPAPTPVPEGTFLPQLVLIKQISIKTHSNKCKMPVTLKKQDALLLFFVL